MRAHFRAPLWQSIAFFLGQVFSSGSIWARSGHGRLGSKQTSRFGAVKSTASDRVSSSEIVRRHFFLQGKDFLPRLRNQHRRLTSLVSASTSAVGIPFEDLDYVWTISRTKIRSVPIGCIVAGGVGLVDMGLDDIASLPWDKKKYQKCNIKRLWLTNCSVREIVNLIRSRLLSLLNAAVIFLRKNKRDGISCRGESLLPMS